MDLSVIILAGGNGTRMCSSVPKVLHSLAGKPLIEHVLDMVERLDATHVHVVHGHLGETVRSAMAHRQVNWVEQKERLGTGHAVQQVLPYLSDDEQVLILYGDVPLIAHETLEHLVSSTGKDQLGLLTATVDNPFGLGRIVRDEYHRVLEIVEEKDATDLQRQIKEINTGIYALSARLLKTWLPRLSSENAQSEFYLTDIVRFASEEHISINVSEPRHVEEVSGVNNRAELSRLETYYRRSRAEAYMLEGTTIIDPDRVELRGDIHFGQDCSVDINVVLEGEVTLGKGCEVGANVILKNASIGDNVVIHPFSMVECAVIQDNVTIGPFARIRPDTVLESGSKVGNFVEVKKSIVGKDSKINHLSYIGDTEIGERVNVGAGTITCNYDGVNKHQTQIHDDAFIGSDSQLIAPVTVGQGATIGAGSTITKNVPAGGLTLSRAKQQHLDAWSRPEKAEAKD